MAKGQISKDYDVVGKEAPSDGANFFENPGIEPNQVSEDSGMKATNSTAPEAVAGKMPSYPKGSGY